MDHPTTWALLTLLIYNQLLYPVSLSLLHAYIDTYTHKYDRKYIHYVNPHRSLMKLVIFYWKNISFYIPITINLKT